MRSLFHEQFWLVLGDSRQVTVSACAILHNNAATLTRLVLVNHEKRSWDLLRSLV